MDSARREGSWGRRPHLVRGPPHPVATPHDCAMSRKPTPHRPPRESVRSHHRGVNDNGSIRRIDHGDVVVNLFLGSEIEGGPANVYLRRHAAPRSTCDAAPRAGEPRHDRRRRAGLVARGEWQGDPLRRRARARGSRRRRGSGTSALARTSGATRATVDARLRAGPGARALRRDPHERVLREPVRRLRAARASRRAATCWRSGRTCRWAAATRGRRSARSGTRSSFATDALELHGLATRAGDVAAGLARRRCPARAASTSTRWP